MQCAIDMIVYARPVVPSACVVRLELGRQEDAHEFLRLLVDGMHKRWLTLHGQEVRDDDGREFRIQEISCGECIVFDTLNSTSCPCCGYSIV